MKAKFYLNCAGISALLLSLASSLEAGPSGATTVRGQAEFTGSDGNYQIQQHSHKAVIEYQDFSLAADEVLHINQPAADAALLNRVVGHRFSQIDGQIHANGEVFIVNQNGVIFGEGALLNVAGLTVSTLDLTADQFMAAELDFSLKGQAAAVENYGEINTGPGGLRVIAPVIINDGDIRLAEGGAQFAAGSAVLLQTHNSAIPLLVESDEYAGVIEQRGSLSVSKNSEQGVELVMLAPDGKIELGGELNLDSQGDGVRLELESRLLALDGYISMRAARQSGQARIYATEQLEIRSASQINADGIGLANGGSVVLYSEGRTWFADGAELYARGGELGGDGGFIEVSGLRQVIVDGWADASALAGEAGLFYIDPIDISIQAPNGSSVFNGSIGGPFNWDASGETGTSLIEAATIEAILGIGTSVTINTASGSGGVGDINIREVIDIDGASVGASLNFIADGSIAFDSGAGISDSNTATDEGVALNFTAGGNFTMANNSFIRNGSGDINITAGANVRVTEVATSSASSNAMVVSAGNIIVDDFVDASEISAVNGRMVLSAANGIGATDSIEIQASELVLTTTAGNVDLLARSSLDIAGLSVVGQLDIHSENTLGFNSSVDIDGAGTQSWNFSAATDINFNSGVGFTDSAPASSERLDYLFDAGGDINMPFDSYLRSGDGTITMNAGGSVRLSELATDSSRDDAININALNQILDDLSDGTEVNARFGRINLQAGTGIGSGFDLELHSDSLSLSSGADINVVSDSQIVLVGLNTGADTSVIAAGALFIADALDINGLGASRLHFESGGNLQLQNSANVFDSDTASIELVDLSYLSNNTSFVMAAGTSIDVSQGTVSISAADAMNLGETRSQSNSVVAIQALTASGIDTKTGERLNAVNGGIFLSALGAIGGNGAVQTNTAQLNIAAGNALVNIDELDALELTALGGTGTANISTGAALTVSQNIDLNGRDGQSLNFSSANSIFFADAVSLIDSDTASPDNVALSFTATEDFRFNSGAAMRSYDAPITINVGDRVDITNAVSDSSSATAFVVSARELRGGQNQIADIAAPNGTVSVTGQNNILGQIGAEFEIDADELQLNMSGSGRIDLQLLSDTYLSVASGLNETRLTVEGELRIPDTGLDVGNSDLFITATDLYDSDRTISTPSLSLVVKLSAAKDDINFVDGMNFIDFSAAGQSFSFVSNNTAMRFEDLDNDGFAVNIDNGNFSAQTINNYLSVRDNVLVSDSVIDGERRGLIRLEAAGGDLGIGTNRDMYLRSQNLVEPTLNAGLGDSSVALTDSAAIFLSLADNSDQSRSINIGRDDVSSFVIEAIGGDIVIDAYGQANTETANFNAINLSAGASVSAYNNISDARDGQLFSNSLELIQQDPWFVRSDRIISVRPDELGFSPVEVPVDNPVNPIDPGQVPVLPPAIDSEPVSDQDDRQNIDAIVSDSTVDNETVKERIAIVEHDPRIDSADENFDLTFGTCVASDTKRDACTVKQALRRFMSQWTVGGRLPPKVN